MTAAELLELPFVEHVSLEGLDRSAWLEARRAGLGSSDAPAVCGLDSYKSPLHVYADKLGELDEEPDNPGMEWGRRLERAIGEAAAERLEATLIKPPAMYRHPEIAWKLASPDFFVYVDGEIGIVEVKTTNWRRADEWEDGAPSRVQVQVQHQHAVLGTERGWIARLIDGRDFDLVECHRDDEAIAELDRIETDFWGYVDRRELPPVDATESTADALDKLYAAVGEDDLEVELPDTAAEWCDEIRRLTALMGAAKKEREGYRNKLKAELGEATIATVKGIKVATWKPQHRDEVVQQACDFRVLRMAGAPK